MTTFFRLRLAPVALLSASFFFFALVHSAAATTTVGLETIPEQIEGQADGEGIGNQIASVGDVNGDGFGDFLLGADDDPAATHFAYLVYGGAETFSASAVDLSTAPTFTGTLGDASGAEMTVAGAGDVNGDGYDDLLFGDAFRDSATGAAYLVYGQAAEFTGDNILESVGVRFAGEAVANYAGVALAGAGDVNADGYDDFLVGAHWHSTKSGAGYLYYGKATDFTNETLGTTGIKFTGESTENQLGNTVAAAGDLNADGYDDFVLGASKIGTYKGAAYVFYGSATAFVAGSVDDRADTLIYGDEAYDGISSTLSAGDIDGDGYDDLVIGSSEQTTGDLTIHASYLFYGGASELASVSPSAADAIFSVGGSGDSVTYVMHIPGDLNGDGIADLVIGIPDTDSSISIPGSAYLFFGSGSRFSGSVDFTTADYEFTGTADGDRAGGGIGGADVNGDGLVDLLVGAGSFTNLTGAVGATYVIFMQLDADGDGVTGADGQIEGTDCDDSDAGVTEEEVYYADDDSDGLGDPVGAVVSVCASTPPDGFAENTSDTNDAIMNNGIEIMGDGVDNDGDSEVDEVNTLAENGAHPEYSTYSAKSADDATAAIEWVHAAKKGRIKVRYNDDSVYRYKIFPQFDGEKFTKKRKFRQQARFTVLHPKSKKLAFVNVLNGNVIDRKILSTDPFVKRSLKHFQVRDKWLAVVTAKKQENVQLSIVLIKGVANELGKKSTATVINSDIAPKKTIKNKARIILRDSSGTVLARFFVTKKFNLIQLP